MTKLSLNYQPGDVAEREFFTTYLRCFAGRQLADQRAFAQAESYPLDVIERLEQVNEWLDNRLASYLNNGVTLGQGAYLSSLPYNLGRWLNTNWALLLDLALRTVLVHASLSDETEDAVTKLSALFHQIHQPLPEEES